MRTSDFNQLVVKMYILDFNFVLQVDKTSVMDLYPRKPKSEIKTELKSTQKHFHRDASVFMFLVFRNELKG